MADLILNSVLTCPHCGFARPETMPTDACQFFYECSHCHTMLRPNLGDCCVFCSFGSVKCPPIQQQHECCGVDAYLDSVVRGKPARRPKPYRN